MDHLTELENRSIFIIREAYSRFRNIAMLWSVGKDSTTLLWLCRKAFFGSIPFPVIHIGYADVEIRLDRPVAVDSFSDIPETGRFVLEHAGYPVAGGIII